MSLLRIIALVIPLLFFAFSSWRVEGSKIVPFVAGIICYFSAMVSFFCFGRSEGKGYLAYGEEKIEIGKVYETLCQWCLGDTRVAIIRKRIEGRLLAVKLIPQKIELPVVFMKTTEGDIIPVLDV